MFECTPINGIFGARITGVDLSQADDALIAQLSELLDQYKVLEFPEPGLPTPESLGALADRFGVPETVPHPTHPDYPGTPGVKVLDATSYPTGPNVKGMWHTDGPPRKNRHWISLLQAHDVPEYGRDTVFADMEAALQRVSPPLQAFLESLTAEHSWGAQEPDAPPVEHPMILTHPRTGRKALYVNEIYTRRIVGLSRAESDQLLAMLYAHVRVPELQLRISWKPGMLAMWDNEYTQHYLVLDRPYPRIMHRAMVTPAEFAEAAQPAAAAR